MFSTSFSQPNQVMAQWRIAPGYYLYRQKVHISLLPEIKVDVLYPQGEFKYDAARGRFEAYSGNINVPVLLQTKDQQLQMSVDYQGCSEGGFCYPPMHKNFLLNLASMTRGRRPV